MYPDNVCFEKCNEKIGYRAWLNDMMGQAYPFLHVLTRALFHRLAVHFAVAGSKGF